jgi:hypothetical protein
VLASTSTLPFPPFHSTFPFLQLQINVHTATASTTVGDSLILYTFRTSPKLHKPVFTSTSSTLQNLPTPPINYISFHSEKAEAEAAAAATQQQVRTLRLVALSICLYSVHPLCIHSIDRYSSFDVYGFTHYHSFPFNPAIPSFLPSLISCLSL